MYFSESPPSIIQRRVKLRAVSYTARESIIKICVESSAQFHTAQSQFKVRGFSQVLLHSAGDGGMEGRESWGGREIGGGREGPGGRDGGEVGGGGREGGGARECALLYIRFHLKV